MLEQGGNTDFSGEGYRKALERNGWEKRDQNVLHEIDI